MIKISSEDIRIAIKRGRGLPVDAALEMVDMLDQWQRTARAGKDACLRLEGEIDGLRAKLRVAAEALEASFATCADSPCEACATAARNSYAALAKIRDASSSEVRAPIPAVPRGCNDGCELKEPD